MARPVEPIESRFWRKVNKNTSNGCWEWIAQIKPPDKTTEGGYGIFSCLDYNKGKYPNGNAKQIRKRAHRVSWELTFGSIPNEMCILHKCDNRKCVNPGHLFLGTVNDNNQDMIKKGRKIGRGPDKKLRKNHKI